MRISNEFSVGLPVERAWVVLTDLARVAPCLPGAELTGVAGDTYTGTVSVRVGPVSALYTGTARFTELDADARRAVIDAAGRDRRNGTAAATVTAALRPAGDRTAVSVATDLRLSGRLAQFGSGVVQQVATGLLTEFVTRLEAMLGTA